MMDIEQVQNERDAAEKEISDILIALAECTKCTITDVSVDVLDNTRLGEKPSTTIGRVTIYLRV